MEWLGAVMAGAEADPLLPHVVGKIVRVNAAEFCDVDPHRIRRNLRHEADAAHNFSCIFWPEHFYKWESRELFECIGKKFLFLSTDSLPPNILEPIEGCVESPCLGNGRSPCLKLLREICCGERRTVHFLNHRSSAEERGHHSQVFFLPEEHPDPSETVYFMAGEDEEVAIEILHIDRMVGNELRSI